LYNFGLSDKHNICTINESTYNSGCNHINSTLDSSGIKEYDYSWLQEVNHIYLHNKSTFFSLLPLDSIDYLFKTRVSVIKIDVEGYEYFVLVGAKQILSVHRPVIIIEIGCDNLEKVNKLLGEYNYKMVERLPGENFVYI
jgi:FkbM family methyltransferase